MSFETLQQRLSALQETNAQIQDLIYRLAHLKFQPGSIPLEGGEGDVSAELSEEIVELMKEQNEELEELEQEVGDLAVGRNGAGSDEKNVLVGGVKRCLSELKTARTAFRHAQLTAKANLENAQRTERALLLSSITAPPAEDGTKPTSLWPERKSTPTSKEDKELRASTDVTLALRRTHNLLSSELSRSQFANQTLQESTLALESLSTTYSGLDDLLKTSRQFLGTLLKSQKSDTWYLETAFLILCCTIGWLIFRRWIYGPAWWLVWLPLKYTWKAWMGIFTAVGLRPADNSAIGKVGETTVLAGKVVPTVVPKVSEVSGTGGDQVGTKDGDSLVEEVGRIIDGEEVVGIDSQGNPKKRMWEEEKEAEKLKDEL